MPKRKRKPMPKHRNPYAVAARARKAGPMKDRRKSPRGLEKKRAIAFSENCS